MQKSKQKLGWLAHFAAMAVLLQASSAPAQEPRLEMPDQEDAIDAQWQMAWESMMQGKGNRWNVEMPTLGGKQIWTDHRWWHGYRMQHNHRLDHWRVIDPKAIRKGWGTKEAMLQLLEGIQRAAPQQENAPERQDPKEVFLLLHGLMRTAASMKPIEQELVRRLGKKQESDTKSFETEANAIVRFQYASTRASIASHAEAFRELAENLPGEPRIKIAAHSLGSIVTRFAMRQWKERGDPHGVLGRIDRVVMMGPPNQGSSFAKQLSQLGLFEVITGKSGMQLGPQWDGMNSNAGIPPCPFSILAGDVTGMAIQNPLLDGPNDGVVTVQETKLEGMTEFKTYPVLHSFLIQDARCVRDAAEFLLRDFPSEPRRP